MTLRTGLCASLVTVCLMGALCAAADPQAATRGALAEKEKAYRRAVKERPADQRAVVDLAHFLLGTDRYKGGLALLRKYADEVAKPEDRHLAVIEIGRYQATARQFSAAQDSFKSAVKMAPKLLATHRALADFYWQVGRYQLARDAYLKAKEISKGKDIEVRKRLIQLYLNLDQAEKAEVEPHLPPPLPPRDAPTHLLKALTILGKGRSDELLAEAMKSINKALKLDPDYALAHYHRGRLLWFQQQPGAAMKALRRAAELDPNNMDAVLLRAKVLAAEDKQDQAIAELETALRVVPDHYDVMVELCRQYATAKQVDKLQALAERGGKLFPKEAIWAGYPGQVKQAGGDWIGAIEAFERAVQLSNYEPLYVDLLLNVMGLAKQWQPLVDRAEKILREIESLTMPAARRRRVQVICILRASNAYFFGLKDEDKGKGKELLQKAILISVDDEEIRNWLYRLLLRSKRLEETEDLLAKAIERNPQNHALRLSLAWLEYRGGNFAESRKLLEALVGETSADKRAFQQLALVYYNLNMNRKAAEAFRKALDLDASDFTMLNNYAWFVAERKRDYAVALMLAYRAKALKPEDATVLDTVGWIEYLNDSTDKAIRALRASMAIEPMPANAYHLAVAYKSRDTDSYDALARALARRAIRLDPMGARGHFGKQATELLADLSPAPASRMSGPSTSPDPN